MIAPPLYTFDIPRVVAERSAFDGVKEIAKLAEVGDRRFSYAYPKDGSTCQISCSREMAECLIEAWRMLARDKEKPSELVHACGQAIDAAMKAVGS